MEQKYTSRKMPIISEETLEAISARYSRRVSENGTDYGNYLTEVQQRIIKEDASLRKFIEMQASKFPRELHNLAFEALVGLYALIETQTETNNLEENSDKL